MRPLYGLGLGWLAGTVLAGLLGLSHALGADGSSLPEGITRLELAGLYIGGGSFGGLLLGLALPLARSLIGSMLVGALAVTPFFVGQAYLQARVLEDPPLYDAAMMIALFAVVGGFVGWNQYANSEEDDSSNSDPVA